jgi:hypothetical protein
MDFRLEDYVRVIATGAIGRIEQWTEATNQYLVEFNRDSGTRQWFKAAELQRVSQGNVKFGSE